MWTLDTDRKGLLNILHAGKEVGTDMLQGKRTGTPIQEGRIRLLWQNKEKLKELPVAVLVRKTEINDFFAWTNTYLPNWSPITAFFRVLSDTMFEEINNQEENIFDRTYETAAVGLIIAEAIIQSRVRYEYDRVPLNGCIATYSFVAARGTVRGIALEDLAKRWDMCRQIVGQGPLPVKSEHLCTPWEVLIETTQKKYERKNDTSTAKPTKTLENAFIDISTQGKVGSVAWKALTNEFPGIRNAMHHMQDTQETRIITFERVLKETLRGRKAHSLEASFLLGYMASLIAPGSLKHADLLIDHVDSLPTAIMWLSLFASLHQKSQIRTGNLAHLVWRAMVEDDKVLSRPKSDIALSELQILAEAGYFSDKFRGSKRGRLVVEIVPCVNTVVRWSRQEHTEGAQGQIDLFNVGNGSIRSIAKDLRNIQVELDRVLKSVDAWMLKRN